MYRTPTFSQIKVTITMNVYMGSWNKSVTLKAYCNFCTSPKDILLAFHLRVGLYTALSAWRH